MKTIYKETHMISGGNAGAAVAVAATVITGTAAVIEAGKTFVDLGQNIGESIYNKVHPDSGMGKMHYEKKDYSPLYFEYHYPSNHNHGDSFHNSFGGF